MIPNEESEPYTPIASLKEMKGFPKSGSVDNGYFPIGVDDQL